MIILTVIFAVLLVLTVISGAGMTAVFGIIMAFCAAGGVLSLVKLLLKGVFSLVKCIVMAVLLLIPVVNIAAFAVILLSLNDSRRKV